MNVDLKKESYDYSKENAQFKALVDYSVKYPEYTLLCTKAKQNDRGFFKSVIVAELDDCNKGTEMEWGYIDLVQDIPSFDDEFDITTFIAVEKYKDLANFKWLAIKAGQVHEVI